MAINTASDRVAIMGLGGPRRLFIPDGTVAAQDRAILIGLYAGFTTSTTGGLMGMFAQRRRRRAFVVLWCLLLLLV